LTQGAGDDGHITRLLREAGNGDRSAEAELLHVLYDNLHRLARRLMRGEGASTPSSRQL
jgi:DNA-directed RNA polymerase specialized sigma24 family protein